MNVIPVHNSDPGSKVVGSGGKDRQGKTIVAVPPQVVASQERKSASKVLDNSLPPLPPLPPALLHVPENMIAEGFSSLHPPLVSTNTLAVDLLPLLTTFSSSASSDLLAPSPPISPPPLHLLEPPPGLVELDFKLQTRARGGLGIIIVAAEDNTTSKLEEEQGVFVIRRITPGGVAAKDGQLRIGDQLRSVNGRSLLDMSHAVLLQAVNEANKEMKLVVWRNLHQLASSSFSSLESCSDLTAGSRANIYPAQVKPKHLQVLPSPAQVKPKHLQVLPSPAQVKPKHLQVLPSPAQVKPKHLQVLPSPAQSLPPATRFSFADFHTPPQRESPLSQWKRWNNVLDTQRVNYLTTLSSPELMPPADVPARPPPRLFNTPAPDIPGTLLGTPLPLEPQKPLVIGTSPFELPPPLTFLDIPLPEVVKGVQASSTPRGLPHASPPLLVSRDKPEVHKVLRGQRSETFPFSIELNKGVLGVGVKLMVDDSTGMLLIKTLSSRSIIRKDNTIRY